MRERLRIGEVTQSPAKGGSTRGEERREECRLFSTHLPFTSDRRSGVARRRQQGNHFPQPPMHFFCRRPSIFLSHFLNDSRPRFSCRLGNVIKACHLHWGSVQVRNSASSHFKLNPDSCGGGNKKRSRLATLRRRRSGQRRRGDQS